VPVFFWGSSLSAALCLVTFPDLFCPSHLGFNWHWRSRRRVFLLQFFSPFPTSRFALFFSFSGAHFFVEPPLSFGIEMRMSPVLSVAEVSTFQLFSWSFHSPVSMTRALPGSSKRTLSSLFLYFVNFSLLLRFEPFFDVPIIFCACA